MERLDDMMARFAQQGRVTWIGVRPARRADMRVLEEVGIGLDGLAGDRARAGKRAVTLLQAEHLPVISAFLGQAVRFEALRRNIAVAELNLSALKGALIRVGAAELRVTGIAAPCSRMEETFGPGGYTAVRGHGGMTAEVITPGQCALGDAVVVLEPPRIGA